MNANELTSRAESYFRANHPLEAECALHAALGHDPTCFAALELLARMSGTRHPSEHATKFLGLAAGAGPETPEAYFYLGLAFGHLGFAARASVAFKRATELRPDWAGTHHNLGFTYQQMGLFDEAIASYRRAMTLEPERPGPLELIRAIEQQGLEIARLAEYVRSAPRAVGEPISGQPAEPKAALASRQLFPQFLNQLGLGGIGAEVGVAEGVFSEYLLRTWRCSLFYSIDPWRDFADEADRGAADDAQIIQDVRYVRTIRRLQPFGPRSVIWRATSSEAASLTPEQSLDFCYVDANHEYAAVAQDIALWWDKVHPGGVLGGHDYIADGTYPFGVFGVQRAVKELVQRRGLELFLTRDSPPSWFVVVT